MNLEQAIAEQERKKLLLKPKIKPKQRISANKKLQMQREQIKSELLASLREHKRNCPKDWIKGFDMALSQAQRYFDELISNRGC